MPLGEEVTYQPAFPALHPSVTCRKQRRARKKTLCKLLVAKVPFFQDLVEMWLAAPFGMGGGGVFWPSRACSVRCKSWPKTKGYSPYFPWTLLLQITSALLGGLP